MAPYSSSQHNLTSQQQLYAALKVFEALDLPRDDLPIMGMPPRTE